MLASQRDLFDIPRDICYLNSASYSPLPLKTQEAARAAVGRKGQALDARCRFCRPPARPCAPRRRSPHQRRYRRRRADTLDQLRRGDGGKAPDNSARRSRAGAGKRSLLAGAGMADARGRAGFCRRDDPPARRWRLDFGGACRHRTAGRGAGCARIDLVGALVRRRPDRPRQGRRPRCAGKAPSS